MVAARAVLFALVSAGMLLAATADAQERVPSKLCGNGYCDAWDGEDAGSCPEDCRLSAERAREELTRTWRSGDPIPPGFHVEKRRPPGLLISGSVLLGAFWATSAAIGATQMHNGGAYSFIPLAGPFISAYSYQPPPCHGWLCLNFDGVLYGFGVALAGVGQLAGAALLTTGLIVRRDTLVPGILPVPIFGRDHAGVGFAGAF